jgi:hypothetical protein
MRTSTGLLAVDGLQIDPKLDVSHEVLMRFLDGLADLLEEVDKHGNRPRD